ncbi:MAG: hypothetical protein V7606_1406 [Burkholderiales bacterium]
MLRGFAGARRFVFNTALALQEQNTRMAAIALHGVPLRGQCG